MDDEGVRETKIQEGESHALVVGCRFRKSTGDVREGICKEKREEGRQEVWGLKFPFFLKEVVEGGGLGHLPGDTHLCRRRISWKGELGCKVVPGGGTICFS